MRRAELLLESGGSAGYLASRMLRPWWIPYPMAKGEERRIKRREAILDVVVLYQGKQEDAARMML